VDFCLALKILILKILVLQGWYFVDLQNCENFTTKNFFLKEKSLNLKNFTPLKVLGYTVYSCYA